ncbi:spermidine/putrescine ABC transporter ATP-binding protein [Bacillus thuringiensis]|nr:spermidine/putrescine ABC transporter ATP-binding protein [Bacillus thuringiensis]MCU4816503.1 spermidine/putrescine ABC transporter ATP-binding protein [Bacillus cereus]MCU4893567.1 spermidine/putrescine ABC transporter ATP-binding protein [Bacillus cereus]MEC3595429.1 spermidine/putrescine ABC transporter ATP-binding protein [Bacillus thuringiensis]MED1836011.1 spermidine/putrescine ABC transporter ATP-binding protein [Bacillus thuringiensis]MED2207708.1 spermidine/putrescine ABC transpor
MVGLFVWYFLFLYPALTGSKTPHQNSGEAKKLGGGRTARKSPIGEG